MHPPRGAARYWWLAASRRRQIDLAGLPSYVQFHQGRRAPPRTVRENNMSGFDERQKGQEAKFALDAEQRFKAEARRNKLLGLWAAEQMGLSDEHAKEYAAEVIAADFEEAGEDDVFRKISGDLKAKGSSVSDEMIRKKMAELVQTAREQIIAER
jgi:hypothetical protein